MAIVTYFFGAGASIQALPAVKSFEHRFNAFVNMLHQHCGSHRYNDRFKNYFNEVACEVSEFYSIDTYAWALNERNDKAKYEAFKILLSYYFLFEQFKGGEELLPGVPFDSPIKKDFAVKKDKRYQPLMRFILQSGSKAIKDHVRIISWNYDLQLEINYAELFNLPIIQAYREMKIFPTIENGRSDLDKRAHIVKVNGTAGIGYDHTKSGKGAYYLFVDHADGFNKYAVDSCLDYLSRWLFDSNHNIESLIEYAWEADTEVKSARIRAKEILAETEVLVIIGYSFPPYNKEIDKELFADHSKMQKVYYNLPANDYDGCLERMESIAPDLARIVVHKKDLSEFYFPEEL